MALMALQGLIHKHKPFSFEKYVIFVKALRTRYICYKNLTNTQKYGIIKGYTFYVIEHQFDFQKNEHQFYNA